MKKILIAGFEAFHTFQKNPAQLVAQSLDATELLCGHLVVSCILPVVRKESAAVLLEAVQKHSPVAVLALGQARRRSISLERVAINVDDFRIPDNAGHCVEDEPIVPSGPAAYWSNLPIKAIQMRLREEGIPVEISNSAGTFVCNHLFYQMQHFLKNTQTRSGFIHIPLLPEQELHETQMTMTLVKMIDGIRLAAEVVGEHVLRDSS